MTCLGHNWKLLNQAGAGIEKDWGRHKLAPVRLEDSNGDRAPTTVTGISNVSSTLLVWSQNNHDTAINYTLVLKSRPNCVLHMKLYYDHNFDKTVLLLRDILLPHTVMEPYPPPFEPTKSRATNLTHNDRIRVATLRKEGYMYKWIHQRLDCTLRQVQYALQHPFTPKKHKGRPFMLIQEETDEIITWICYSKVNWCTSWMKIPAILKLDVSYYCVCSIKCRLLTKNCALKIFYFWMKLSQMPCVSC